MVNLRYNNAGQKTGVKIWNGSATNYSATYEYYANGWLKAVKYGGTTIASYSYDAVGNRTQVDYGNGTFTKFDYEATDPRYRLETITHKYGATELAKFGYTRDNVGNPLSISWRQNSTTFEWEYDYDAMNRLASAAPPEEGPLLPLPAQAGGTYSYDWVGNMKAAASGNPWQYNSADQLTLWPGMHSYSYDDNGALTAVKTADGQTEQQTFTYHPTGLMNEAEFGGQTLTNLWDADEHRVGFSVGQDVYTAVFDVTAGIPAVIKELTPGDHYYYVREPDGSLIARVGPETMHYYHFDELGSTRLITENSGIVTDRYTYDAYGAVLTHEASDGTISQPYQYVGRLGYYTHYDTPEFGWLQLGVRFYDPETGRFERRDPLGPTPVYHYAVCAPLGFVDPSGLLHEPYDPAPRDAMTCLSNLDARRQIILRRVGLEVSRAHDRFYHESLQCAVLSLLCPICGAACEADSARRQLQLLRRIEAQRRRWMAAAVRECTACMTRLCGEPRLCQNRGSNPGGHPWD